MQGESVVLIHGLWLPGWAMEPLARRLRSCGYAPQRFAYASVAGGLDENAERLAQFLERAPGHTVHAVGHSLGGVLLLHALARHPLRRPGRVLCMGSPLLDTRAGRALRALPGGRSLVGRTLLEHLERGGLHAWSGERELGLLAGERPLGAGRLLTALPRPHDGTVCADEMQLAGAADAISLPVSHFTMLFSRAAAQQVASFLSSGRFERAAGRAGG